MATKPFYSLSETQSKLGLDEAQLQQLVRDGKIQQITSQGQKHFRSVDVERMAVELGLVSELPKQVLEPVLPDSAPLDLSTSPQISEQSKDLGLSESVGFAVPAESHIIDERPGSMDGMENDLGSAELGLSESVGFSLAEEKSVVKPPPPDTGSKAVPLSMGSGTTPPPPPLEEGELGLSESIGFSQLDEGPDKIPPGTDLSASGTIPADTDAASQALPETGPMDMSLSHDLAKASQPDNLASSGEIGLQEADKPAKPSKGDTVITSAGISVFDDEDLEATAADPMAKTTIAPSVDEQQLSLEGVGSGSGLLDLTRETDDTSLDAELLDEIYPGSGQQMSISAVSSAHGSTLIDRGTTSAATSAGSLAGIDQFAALPQQVVVEYVEEVEKQDPYEIAFTITLIVATIVMFLVGMTSASLVSGVTPGFVKAIAEGWTTILIIAIAVTVLGLVIGLLLGRQQAKRLEMDLLLAERQAAKEEKPEAASTEETHPTATA